MGFSIANENIDLRNNIERDDIHRDIRRYEDSRHQRWCGWRKTEIHPLPIQLER